MYRTLTHSTLAIALIAALGGSAYAQASSHSATSSPSETAAAARDKTRATADAHTRETSRDVDRARVYLNRAQLELGRKEHQRTAANLRNAAAAIDQQAARAHGESNVELVRDATALRAMAAEVEAGRITDANAFKRRLTDIRADLARYHYTEAGEAWAKQEYEAAGRSLAAAARYLESSFTSLGEKSSAELKSAEASASKLARKGASAVESEYQHARDAVERGLERLRTAREAQKTSWPAQSPFDQGA